MTELGRWIRGHCVPALAVTALVACGPADEPPAAALAAAPAAPQPSAAADLPSTEQVFQWAQMNFPDLFPDAPPLATVTYQGRVYEVRSYANGNHLGVSDGQVYGLGSFTQGRLQDFGAVAGWADTVCPVVGCGAWDAERGQADTSVTVQPPTVSGLVQTVPRGSTMAAPQVGGTITGKVTALAGKPLWVVVEDPSSLFEASAQVRLQSGNPWRYTLDLQPRKLPRAGRFTGTLRAFACLDSGCATRLGGTPLRLPYDVTVVQGLKPEPAALSFGSTTGVEPAAQMVTLGFDPRVTGGAILSVLGGRLTQQGGSGESAYAAAELAGSQLRVRVSGARPGLWQGAVTVELAYRLPASPDVGRIEQVDIPVSYTVTGGTALAVPVPAQLDFRIGAGLEEDGYHSVQLLMESGLLQYLGVAYDNHPAAETDAALLAGWVDHLPTSTPSQFMVRSRTCRPDGSTRRCLAPGVYTAQVRYRAYLNEIRDGQLVETRSEVVALPVTLTVVAR